VIFTWRARNGVLKRGHGMTLNICLKGMFVTSYRQPPVSSLIRCVVVLPTLESDSEGGQHIVLEAVGRVVRTKLNRIAGFGINSRALALA
jgi:hypothetical protein